VSGVRLSWNEVRAHAARFADEWKGYEKEESRTCYNEFFEVFGDYFPGLKNNELPCYLPISDLQNFGLYDLDSRGEVRFANKNPLNYVQAVGFYFRRHPECLQRSRSGENRCVGADG
jgi:hypothetical protein